jgi:protein-disulfide isomerase
MNTTVWSAKLAAPVLPNRDHIRGPASARVTLLEYGDYECPYCSVAHGIVHRIQTQLQNPVCFVFRHFPITTVHPHAQLAAEAAEAAVSQGKFWQMHDALFASERPLSRATINIAAATIGLNLDSFGDEIRRHVHARRIREDFISGVRSGVNGTPTFFINSVRYDGPPDFPSLSTAITRAITMPVKVID